MIAVTDLALAVLLGGALGVGVWSLFSLTPRWRALPLARRIAPYVRDVTDAAGTTRWEAGGDPLSAARNGAHALFGLVHASAGRWLGGSERIALRLSQAGLPVDVPAHRARQLGWALAGAAAGGAAVITTAVAGTFTPPAIVLPAVGAATAVAIRDAVLASRARARMARVGDELPTVLEFVALCLAAGEGIVDSLQRVSRVGSGELAGELRTVMLEVSTGTSLPEALKEMSDRLQVPALTRAVEHIVSALDRGAPLAQALQAQALDAREDAKRSLIELAGRREILMMIPLVFGLLPVSVLFAVFPGIVMLRLGIG